MLLILGMGQVAACVQADDDEPATVTAVQARITTGNRLALNRLALNRLALNRLALNRLALNGVTPGDLGAEAASALLATEDGREVLRYVVQCALGPEDTLYGTVAGQTYAFPGLLGLVPKWKDKPLTAAEQQRMSACLLAHVNALNVPVSISVRSHHLLRSTEEERQAYPVYEGTFFGQLFGGNSMKAYSCQGSTPQAALAHSQDRALRRCTDGTGECAIVSLGRCQDVCEERTDEEGWNKCWASGVRYEDTVSVYLFADDADGQNQGCQSNDCTLHNQAGTAAILDCNGRDRCAASCPADATCTIDGSQAKHPDIDVVGAEIGEVDCFQGEGCAVACLDQASCDIECTDAKGCGVTCSEGSTCDVNCRTSKDCAVACSEGSTCDVDCYLGEGCQVACSAGATCDVACGGPGESCENIDCQAGSTCELQCRNADECRFAQCQEGAACLLECENTERCEFAHCAGGAMTCGDGVVVCGRSCP